MASWVPVSEGSDFSLHNLPYGVFSTAGSGPRIGIAIGDLVLDLKALAQDKVFDRLGFDTKTLEQATLNAYAALGRKIHRQVRSFLQDILQNETQLGDLLRDNQARRDGAPVSQHYVTMHLPMAIGDYTDFFVGYSHAVNCANIMRGQPIEEVCPCFYHLPVAYHGRASSVVVSGTNFHRPKGQFPVNGKILSEPCRKFDYEVEFACLISHGNKHGTSTQVDDAEDHIFGFVLMNDWSARDIQMFEASMMGPFQGKNFCTTISPWIVPFDALEPFRTHTQAPRQLAEYLTASRKDSAYDVPVVATLTTRTGKYRIAKCNTNNLIFSFAQMLAHHTRGGYEIGCFIESTVNGKDPYDLPAEDGTTGTLRRYWLEDSDTVEFSRTQDGYGVGFGVCGDQVLSTC